MPSQKIAIITARGGSKRIPRKNIRPFLGQPIIAYSIKAALESACFDTVMVSTDDEEIAAVAKKYGAEVPFMRSAKNADDISTTADVLEEVLREYQQIDRKFDCFCCIYPTAPFVTAAKLIKAFELIEHSGADSVLPVTTFSYPILRSLKVADGRLAMNWPEYLNTRSQDLPPAYHDVGQFYVMRTDKFWEKKKLITDFTVPLEIPEPEVQDIDNETDWLIAEIKYDIFQKKMSQS